MPAPATRLRWKQVTAWRLGRHHLDERAPATAMLDVVAEIAGLHAQVMPPGWVRRAAEAEAERLAAWAGGQLELRWAEAP
jgi:hypothetical protein